MGLERQTHTGNEISLKIVYWGAKDSGKTENVIRLGESFGDAGRIITLLAEDGFTVYFDFFNPIVKLKNGYEIKYLLYAAPGKEAFKLARNIVLQGSDGIVFVVDSDKDRLKDNANSFSELLKLLEEHEKNYGKIPIVVQYNKRDLPSALPVKKLRSELNLKKYPSTEAVAIDGKGVIEPFNLIAKESLKVFIEKSRSSDFSP
jgi:signal recognition particle receptor subunit beta